jgi:hypothetical protein
MKIFKMVVLIMVGAILGVSSLVLASGEEADTTFKESALPGGGIQVPHNQRFHLSTDQKWISSQGHLSDLIRLQWTKDRAKPAISWADEKGQDKTAIVSHAKANNPDQQDHNHISIETTMSPAGNHPGELYTRFEIPFDQDVSEIRTHSSNFNVMDGIMRIAGTNGVKRDLQWAKAEQGNKVTPRWAMRTDAAEESGGNAGSNLQIIRYSDEGEAVDTPLSITRSSGNIGIGNTDAQTKLDIEDDSIRIRKSMTPASSSAPGHVGEIAWDNGYLYVCIAKDTWKRAELVSW